MSGIGGIDAQRRRLTVSKCDPVASTSSSGGTVGLKELGLEDLFNGPNLAVSITSLTDKDLKRRRSFSDKDKEILVSSGDQEAGLKFINSQFKVGWSCKKGLKPESPNQDSFSILAVDKTFALYGVYDGHGPNGHEVSDLSRRILVKRFLEHPKRDSDTGACFSDIFVQTQLDLEKRPNRLDPSTSGTTCTMAYHCLVKNQLTIAHVGDSRSVIGRGGKTEDLTIDHKPNLDKERARIEGANPPGRVVFDGFYNHRVFAKAGTYPGLNMSRALGDVIAHKEAGLTAEPDIRVVDLNKESGDLCLLICSDGAWEFIESEEAVKFVATSFNKGDYHQASEKLAKESWDRWMKDSDNEISDDITVVVVEMKGGPR